MHCPADSFDSGLFHWKQNIILTTMGRRKEVLKDWFRPERFGSELVQRLYRACRMVDAGYESYYNLSSVTIFVCPLSPRPFMDLPAPNSAGREVGVILTILYDHTIIYHQLHA